LIVLGGTIAEQSQHEIPWLSGGHFQSGADVFSLVMQYVMFKDSTGQWRWHLVAVDNSRVIACAGEGYWNEADCMTAIELVKRSAHAPVHKQ